MRLQWWFIVLAIGVVVIIGVWSLNSRYVVVGTAAGVAYKVDRWTGRSWVLVGQEEFPTRPEEPEPAKEESTATFQEQESDGHVPWDVLNNLTGRAQINSFGVISVSLHNNSDWSFWEILIELTSRIFPTEGKRKCSLTGFVVPYEVGTLRGACLTLYEVEQLTRSQEEWSWYILEARGRKSR